MSWLAPRFAAVLVLVFAARWLWRSKEAPPTELAAPAPVASAPVLEVPRSFLDACGPLAAPAAGKRVREEAVLLEEQIPHRPSDLVEPASQRLGALTAVDELRARLTRDPRNPALHRQLGEIYLYALGNRVAAVKHLCRALIESPTEVVFRDALLAAWMQRGAELELEVALRASDRSLPWREALEEVRGLSGLTEHEAARLFDETIRAQRIVRNGALLKRERTRAVVDAAALINAWVRPDDGALRVVASVQKRDRDRVRTLRNRTLRDALSVAGGPGFLGRWLVFGIGVEATGGVIGVIADRVPDRPVTLFARQGDRQLVLVGRVVPKSPGLLRITSFTTDPEEPSVRATLLASPEVPAPL